MRPCIVSRTKPVSPLVVSLSDNERAALRQAQGEQRLFPTSSIEFEHQAPHSARTPEANTLLRVFSSWSGFAPGPERAAIAPWARETSCHRKLQPWRCWRPRPINPCLRNCPARQRAHRCRPWHAASLTWCRGCAVPGQSGVPCGPTPRKGWCPGV